jgi:hypothetical protein
MSDNLNPWTNLAPVENANAKISNYPAKEGEWQVAHLNTSGSGATNENRLNQMSFKKLFYRN